MLTVWFVAIGALVATTMTAHWYALPVPAKDDKQLAAGLRDLLPDGEWAAVHVLYSQCRCSQRVFDHLFETERPAGVEEIILLVGEDADVEARAAEHGFGLEVVDPTALASRFGLESAPLFLVVGPEHDIRYMGGYTYRQQGPDIQDLVIIDTVVHGGGADDLPVYGCGTSRRLADLQDPFSLKQVN